MKSIRPKVNRAIALTVGVACGMATSPAAAHDAVRGAPDLVLSANGSDRRQQCSQFAMNLSADAAKVRPFVPRAFVFSRDVAGKAVLGYRFFECRSMRIGGSTPRRVVWSELGVRSLPPEGLPEPHLDQHVDGHDYYMLAFRTSDAHLAAAVRRLGLVPPAEPETLARELSYSVVRGSSPLDSLGDPLLSDVARPLELETREAVPGGSYATDVLSPAGLWYQKATGPLDVREWFVRSDCKVISVFEHKERPTALIPSIALTAEAETLIGRLVDTTAGADGRKRLSSSTDVYVQFDEQMTWRVRDMPRPLSPALYAGLRGLSSARAGARCGNGARG